MTDEPKGPQGEDKTHLAQREGGTQDASLDAVLAETADSREVIGERQGMFGVHDGGDTSGYGGLRRPVTLPGATPPPYGGWMDEVADALVSAAHDAGLEAMAPRVVIHRGEITFHVRREDLPVVA